jgi:peptidoglycan/xylan/chitin deacetylase (PgdA/CDA1 family)
LRLASLGYRALKRSGLTFLARRLSSGGVILCYHNIVAPGDARGVSPLGLHMPFPTFERQVRWLAAHYDVVPLDTYVDRASHGHSLSGVAAVTFDDAYTGVFDHAWPLLQELHIPATVFVVADAPGRDAGFWWDDPEVLRGYTPARRDRWLTALHGDGAAILASLAPGRRAERPSAQCRPAPWSTITAAAASGMQLGAHSATHRSLPSLPESDLRQEIVVSRDVIAQRTQVVPAFFAYPYGLWNDGVRDAVRAAGYRAAFTLDDGGPGRNGAANVWSLPRVNIPEGIEDAAFEAWTAGLRLRRRGS